MPRDNFSHRTLDALAKRVGFRCSNPKCRRLTAGPRTEIDATISIGVGAHITAASVGGPRFNPEISNTDRSGIGNGIWLCQNCAKLIDNDPTRYSADLLHIWKSEAEESAHREISEAPRYTETHRSETQLSSRRQKIAAWRTAVASEKYDFVDYRSTFLGSAAYSSLRPHLRPEVVAKIESPRTFYVGGARGDNVRQYMLLDEIMRIERDWGLV